MGETLLTGRELCVASETEDVVASIREGISHLHNFHPFEAMRSLRRGMRSGGKCCSLYWGMSMLMDVDYM